MRVWDIGERRCEAVLSYHQAAVFALLYHPPTGGVLSADRLGCVRLSGLRPEAGGSALLCKVSSPALRLHLADRASAAAAAADDDDEGGGDEGGDGDGGGDGGGGGGGRRRTGRRDAASAPLLCVTTAASTMGCFAMPRALALPPPSADSGDEGEEGEEEEEEEEEEDQDEGVAGGDRGGRSRGGRSGGRDTAAPAAASAEAAAPLLGPPSVSVEGGAAVRRQAQLPSRLQVLVELDTAAVALWDLTSLSCVRRWPPPPPPPPSSPPSAKGGGAKAGGPKGG